MTEIAVINVQLAPHREPRNKWERERAAFAELLPSLLPHNRGKYVAIHDGAVAAVADDPIAAAMEAYAKHGYVPIHVGLATYQPQPVIRVPSPRLRAPAFDLCRMPLNSTGDYLRQLAACDAERAVQGDVKRSVLMKPV